jgi:hypothetical protein
LARQIAPDATAEGQAENRRVVVRILQNKESLAPRASEYGKILLRNFRDAAKSLWHLGVLQHLLVVGQDKRR